MAGMRCIVLSFGSLGHRPWWVGLGLLGCSAIVEPDLESLGPAPLVCEPLACNLCRCLPSGADSYQVCTDEGIFEPCRCPPPGPIPASCVSAEQAVAGAESESE